MMDAMHSKGSPGWKMYIAKDVSDFLWVIYSVNPDYAFLRLKDFGIRASSIRVLTEEETVLHTDEIEVAKAHKNIAVFAGR